MFLLVLSKEIEVFVSRVISGQQGSTETGTISTSMLAALGPSFIVAASASSKFQRMLVYKAAEWYGLKAVPGQDGTMIIGVLEPLHTKR